jgi:hypothetical protein
MNTKPFSQRLDEWLKNDKLNTLEDLINAFAEISFAMLFLILMAIPALPLPTGGATHVFEIISMLLALELIAGARKVWLPKKWIGLNLPIRLQNSTLPFLIRIIRKVEKYSRPRFSVLISNAAADRIIGLLVFILSLFAFLAPPFSGLDTLPALGVVIISLALILEDFLLFLFGLVLGAVGIGLVIGIGKAIISMF